MFTRRRREEIIRTINTELAQALHCKNENISTRFVCEDDIRKIWSSDRIAGIAKGFRWSKSQEDVEKRYRKILSTLVWIHWDKWESFGDIFLNSPNRSDNNIPIEDVGFLGSDSFVHSFMTSQYIFKPVVLAEDDRTVKSYSKYTEHHRLPFLDSKKIGQGSSGIVNKVVIPPGYIKLRGNGSNSENYCVAVKFFKDGSDIDDFDSEQQTLRAFKECQTRNENIMLSLMSFQHGKQFIIISELADLSLHDFLGGKYDDFEERFKGFSPEALLRESKCLAGALNFLHDGLQTRTGRFACAHFDLKPENILVQWRSNNYPVGFWMISDFGTSRIKDISTGDSTSPGGGLMPPADSPVIFSPTVARRGPGAFQAPEVQSMSHGKVVGRESDMWSFGCIMAFILAFATGGPGNAIDLRSTFYRKNTRGGKDEYPYMTNEANDIVLKPSIKNWLENLQRYSQPQGPWVGKTLELIFDLLKTQPLDRLRADQASNKLEQICLEGGLQFGGTIPRINPKAELPVIEPGSPIGLNSVIDSLSTGQETKSSEASAGTSVTRSSHSQILALTDEISFIKLRTPEKTLRTAICPLSCHVAFLSKRTVVVHSMADDMTWFPKSQRIAPLHSTARFINCPDGYEWNYISITSNYICLRLKERGGLELLRRYRFDTSEKQWNEAPLPSFDGPIGIHALARISMHLAVSSKGDMLFIGNETLYCYSLNNGLKQLEIEGQLQRCGAAFSPDGNFIYGWSYDRVQLKNYWYIWVTNTLERLATSSTLRIPENSNGRDTLFPLSTYFAVFERPGRIHVVRKNTENLEAVKLGREIKNIIGGSSYHRFESGDEALILASSNSLILLQLLTGVEEPSFLNYSLKTYFDRFKDAISVLKQIEDDFVIIAHSDGLLMRRRISVR